MALTLLEHRNKVVIKHKVRKWKASSIRPSFFDPANGLDPHMKQQAVVQLCETFWLAQVKNQWAKDHNAQDCKHPIERCFTQTFT